MNKKERRKIIETLENKGNSLSEIAKYLGVTKGAISSWIKRNLTKKVMYFFKGEEK